jgi:hypothetical protein
MQHIAPAFSVRRNYPYRGTADGFTTYLRRQLSSSPYLGIELEINQRHVTISSPRKPRTWHALQQALVDALRAALDDLDLTLAGKVQPHAQPARFL